MSALRILSVADDPANQELVRTALRRARSEVELSSADSIDEATATLARTEIDCLVTAYELTDGTGIDLLRSIRSTDDRLPVVLLTGEGSERVASDAISEGVSEYLRTDFPEIHERLATRIETMVEEYRSRSELERSHRKVEKLHELAYRLVDVSKKQAVYDLAVWTANLVLEFDICGIYVPEHGSFVAKAELNLPDRLADDNRLDIDEGVVGRSYQEKSSIIVDDAAGHSDAAPVDPSFSSVLTVPIGDAGVFQAISEQSGFFTDRDRELAELLVSHVTQALDRIEYERDLRRTNEQLEAILRNTTALIYIKDLDGRYVLVNDRYAELLGMAREEIIGQTDHDIQDAEFAEQVRENDRRAIERDGPIEVEERAYRQGENKTYYSVKVPIHEDGEPTGVCGISTDITELKRREKELSAQRDRLDRFASVISHDLRNPLSIARGNVDLLLDERDDDRLVTVSEALDRMDAIIGELRQLARSGEAIGETTRIELATVAESAWRTVPSDDATLHVDVDLQLDADRGRLLQLFENLFRNAVTHAAPDPTVRVVELDGGFAVTDDGSGIPSEEREQVLEPGYTTDSDGTGFGLAIVREIAEAHGWSLRIESAESGGARIEVLTDP